MNYLQKLNLYLSVDYILSHFLAIFYCYFMNESKKTVTTLAVRG